MRWIYYKEYQAAIKYGWDRLEQCEKELFDEINRAQYMKMTPYSVYWTMPHIAYQEIWYHTVCFKKKDGKWKAFSYKPIITEVKNIWRFR